ncbi:MAG: M12 family metallopeptidase [Phycisphaerae bacterium]
MKRNFKQLVAAALALGAIHTAVHAAVYIDDTRLWPNGVVPYVYADDFIEENVVPVEAAMAVWEAVANIQFVPRTNEADYVLIRNAGEDNGSSSPFIGRNGGEQPLNIRELIYTWGQTAYTYGLAHEWGHVLGFHHTHQRTDRNTFLTYYDDRVSASGAGNYTIQNSSLKYPRNQMDFDSVMSYGQCIFSTCEDCGADPDNCRVLEINDPADFATWQTSMGQRNHLSDVDLQAMSFMYPLPGWRFIELNYAGSSETGTFHQPYLSMATAVTSMPVGGTLWMQPASYATPAVITKAMTLRAARGSVLLN